MVKGHLVSESSDGIESVHHKEAGLLAEKVSDTLQRHNVILSHDNLRLLAVIHESLVGEGEGQGCVCGKVGVSYDWECVGGGAGPVVLREA